MIFHASIPADDPERVARVIAEIWGGQAFRFPPWPGAFVAMAGDERSTTCEVYPRDQTIAPGEGDAQGHAQFNPAPSRYGCFHLAIATHRTVEDVVAIGEREGWRTLPCVRGGIFGVIELWLEDSLMVEVLTPEMQAQYRAGVKFGTFPALRPAEAAVG